MTVDVFDQLERLLQQPDPPTQRQVRGHHVTYAGDPARYQTVLLPLLVRWAQRRAVAIDYDLKEPHAD